MIIAFFSCWVSVVFWSQVYLDLPRDLDSVNFKELKSLESWQFVWKMNVKNEEDFRGAWEESNKFAVNYCNKFVVGRWKIILNYVVKSTAKNISN